MSPKCTKLHRFAPIFPKNFPGVIPPEPPRTPKLRGVKPPPPGSSPLTSAHRPTFSQLPRPLHPTYFPDLLLVRLDLQIRTFWEWAVSTSWMLFLSSDRQRQSAEGTEQSKLHIILTYLVQWLLQPPAIMPPSVWMQKHLQFAHCCQSAWNVSDRNLTCSVQSYHVNEMSLSTTSVLHSVK